MLAGDGGNQEIQFFPKHSTNGAWDFSFIDQSADGMDCEDVFGHPGKVYCYPYLQQQ
jgi:hypothetical protein